MQRLVNLSAFPNYTGVLQLYIILLSTDWFNTRQYYTQVFDNLVSPKSIIVGSHCSKGMASLATMWYGYINRAVGTGQASQAMAWPVLAAQM